MITAHIADLSMHEQSQNIIVYHKILRLCLEFSVSEEKAEIFALAVSDQVRNEAIHLRCDIVSAKFHHELLVNSVGWEKRITLPEMPDITLFDQQRQQLSDFSYPCLLQQMQARHDELQRQRDALKQEAGHLMLKLKRKNQDMEHQAMHDALTGLPNRPLLMEHARHAFNIARRQKFSCCLMVIDILDLKRINDALGYKVGDLMVQEVSRRLKDSLRTSDTLARIADDAFAVLLLNNDTAQAEIVASKLHQVLGRSVELEGHSLSIGINIGIAEYPRHSDDISILMRQADVAVHYAKKKNHVQMVYSPLQDAHSIERLELLGELKHAIEVGELELYYQPQILNGDGAPSLEALARWPHPKKGMVFPDQFIPLAEESGLIIPMTWWVMETAAAQCAAWNDMGLDVNMSVNFPAQCLQDEEVVQRISDCIARHGLPDNALIMEITESMIMEDPQQASKILLKIDALKVDVSIDDFGTGHSSLAYLKHLLVDELKIDRSFVMGMHENHNDMVIVHTVINMAHNMGLRVVGEGVETRQSLNTLAELGCDRMQGYFISRPQPADTMTGWLEAYAQHGLQTDEH